MPDKAEEEISFQETLELRGTDFALVLVVAVTAGIVAPVSLALVIGSPERALLAVPAVAVSAALVWVLQRRRRTEVDVRVDENGVTLGRTPPPLALGEAELFIAFDDVIGVQYCDGDESPNIHLTEEDKRKAAEDVLGYRPQRYMVARQSSNDAIDAGKYHGGVRIERRNAAPVYVGSDTPRELAEVLAEGAGHDGAEPLFS